MKLFLVRLVLCLISFNVGTFSFAGTSVKSKQVNMDNIFTKSEVIIFIKSSGSDNQSCGSQKEPCKTIKYALERVSTQSNVTSAIVNVLPGVYPPETAKLDCTVGHLTNVTVRGLGGNVFIKLSADIVKCHVTFANMQWEDSTKPILINVIISRFRIINSTMSDIAFTLLSSGSNIEIISSSITKCLGWQPLFPILSSSGISGFETSLSLQNTNFSYNKAPLISAKVSNLVDVKKCNFMSNVVNKGQVLISLAGSQGVINDVTLKNNRGGNIKAIEASVVKINRAEFLGNVVLDSTLIYVGQDGVLRVSRSIFVETRGSSKGPVIRTSEDMHMANLTSCYFSCNQVNNSVNVPPIKNNAASNVLNCTNCTFDQNCPVFCGSGEYLVNDVLCRSCPAGTYSPGGEFNITTFACKECDPGYYSSRTGSIACTPCKAGTFAVKSGSKMCSRCVNDLMTSDEGAASCSKLTIGFTILTICVVLLILFPLCALLIKYLSTSKKLVPQHKKSFRRLEEPVT